MIGNHGRCDSSAMAPCLFDSVESLNSCGLRMINRDLRLFAVLCRLKALAHLVKLTMLNPNTATLIATVQENGRSIHISKSSHRGLTSWTSSRIVLFCCNMSWFGLNKIVQLIKCSDTASFFDLAYFTFIKKDSCAVVASIENNSKETPLAHRLHTIGAISQHVARDYIVHLP